ncbi:unnamed protein product [Protopolystoma xenopodis]|uniref:Profilin n=1 Tax=Protopolystoma xenopodis TaxID=117903 RepID=A0A3S5ARY2_9PLAT|nr:unnamed protein product [Protopolystoma xenopodis]
MSTGELYVRRKLTDDQSKKLAERLKGASTDTSLSVGDVKYMILTSDANGIQARKDKNAFSCSTSTTAIVIACHIHSSDAKDPTPGLNQRLGTASEKIAEYLSQSGY